MVMVSYNGSVEDEGRGCGAVVVIFLLDFVGLPKTPLVASLTLSFKEELEWCSWKGVI